MCRMPERLAKMVSNGILIKVTHQYTYNKTAGGLILPGGDDDFSEKKYRFGEILALGDTVPSDRLHVGDIVVYLNHAAYRMPNGFDEPFVYKLTYNDMTIMAVLPNLDPAKRHVSWNDHPFLSDIQEEIKQWRTGNEALPSTVRPVRDAFPSGVKIVPKAGAKKKAVANKAK